MLLENKTQNDIARELNIEKLGRYQGIPNALKKDMGKYRCKHR